MASIPSRIVAVPTTALSMVGRDISIQRLNVAVPSIPTLATALPIPIAAESTVASQSSPAIDTYRHCDPHSESSELPTSCLQSETQNNFRRRDTLQSIRFIGKRISSIAKAKSRWPDAQASVGVSHGMKGRFDYWEARGRAQECFEELSKEIAALLERTCGPVPASSHVIFNMFMIGEAPETAIPHIMFSCQQSGPRKEAMRALKKSQILSKYPGIEVGHWQFPPHIMNPQPLAAGPRSSLCSFRSTNAKVVLAPFNTSPSEEPLGTSHSTMFAMGICIPSSSHPNTPIATTCSGVYFAGKLFYMTVSHPFEKVLELPDDDNGSEFEFGGFEDIEGELDDDQLETLHDGSMTSLSSDSQPSENSAVDDHAIITWPESLKSPGSEDSTKPEPAMSCSQNGQELDMSFTTPPISEHIYDVHGHSDTGYANMYLVSTDLDYALIEYTHDKSTVSALSFPLLAPETARKVPPGQTRVPILTGRHGQLSGILGGQPSYIRLTSSRTFQETFNVQINGPLMPGDCGSMVIDSETGFLYGHIVVGNPLSRIAYIIPAVNVLKDLKTHEHVQTCLTAKSDSTPQTEERGDAVPLAPIKIHSNSREALLPGSKQVPPPEHVGKDKPLPGGDVTAFIHDRSERSELEIMHIKPHSIPKSRYREAFLLYLKEIQRTNWQNKIFYRPNDIRVWMNAKSLGETCTNIVGLVSTLYDGPLKISAKQCTDVLLVLATLLHPDVNCGHLIHIFARCNFSDSSLFMADLAALYSSIVDDLKAERPLLDSASYEQYDYSAVTHAFDQVRWRFRPAPLDLNMDTLFPPGPYILPFLDEEVVNKKGGTANVLHYKIEENLVESKELKKALESSMHLDPKFGWCYEFAVKSYRPGWEDIYRFESDAFRTVRNHKGIVKYLGAYHFKDGRDGPPTHNIILEYGQQDLDEYLADTYPPVLNAEIIAFWEDLFKVADTLKQLHQFPYKGGDGRVQRYKGWHGDIKPDNILRVRGEFKLADFGFTNFKKDEIGKSSTFILGGTRTYGAPECDQQRYGIRTPYLQTIDTWSFGCVLSAVATWVILGSQAYENYRQVRKQEIETLRKRVKEGKGGSAPSGDDAFHDGIKVLSSVLNWHDFLRNSSRKADTISHRVLDLVEDKMLHQDPSKRLSLEKLCQLLDDIVLLAKNEYQKSRESGQLKPIAADTLEALLQLDRRAPATATPVVQMNIAQNVEQGNESILTNRSDLRPQSERVRKSERLDRIVVGKTANRESAIKTDLLGLGIVEENQEICDSPQQESASTSERVFETFSSAVDSQYLPDSSNKGKEIDIPVIEIILESPATTHFQEYPMDRSPFSQKDSHQSYNYSKPSSWTRNTNSSRRDSHQSYRSSKSSFGATNTNPSSYAEAAQPPSSHSLDEMWVGDLKRPLSPSGNFQQEGESSKIQQLDIFRTLRQMSNGSATYPTQGYDQPSKANQSNMIPSTPTMIPETISRVDTMRTQSRAVSFTSMPTPFSYAIIEEHARLDKLWGDYKGPFSSLSGKIPEDPWLKNFISNRDIVFVVDNADSMHHHWAVATEVLTTLAMKIGPLDKDGLDLIYTIGTKHNLQEVKGWAIQKTFKSSMQHAGSEIDYRYKTNMKDTLEKIFDSYTDTSKKMTLIVLTDGLWEGCFNSDDVEKLIASFITKLKPRLKKWESHWFSIQFVSFGDNEQALERLQKLDDNMPIGEDVIDTKPWWHHDVSKLILGSMTAGDDKGDPLSPPPLSRPGTSAPFHPLPTPERNPSTGKHHRFSFLRK